MTVRRIPILGISTVPDTSGDVYPLGYDFLATNDVWDRMVMAFDGSNSKVGLTGGFTVPEDYRSDPAIKIEWTSAITAGAVIWDFEYRSVGGDNAESFDQGGTQEAVTVSDTAPTAANRKVTSTIVMTEANFVANDEVEFNLFRDGAAESAAFMNSPALVTRVDFVYDTGVGSVPDPDPPDPPAPPTGFIVGTSTGSFAGTFDAAGKAFTLELKVHSIRAAFAHGDHVADVNWAAANGVGCLFFLGYASGCSSPTSAAGRQCYADRSAGLALQFGTKVQFYEVWNEWNGIFCPGGTGFGSPPCNDGAMYADLVIRTSIAVKAAVPAAKIVGGVTGGVDVPFLRLMLQAGAGPHIDYISVHPYVYYPNTFSVGYTGTVTAGVNKVIEALTAVDTMCNQEVGRSIPLFISEDNRSDHLNAAERQKNADYIRTLLQRLPVELPICKGYWIYELEDQPANQPGWGMLTSSNARKQNFFEFQAAAIRLL